MDEVSNSLKVMVVMTILPWYILHKICSITIKGYLHYKTITSENVLSEAQVKNFFIS